MTSAPRLVPQQGFTLIEILVALMIFMAGVSGVYALISTGLAMQRDGLQMSAATRRLDAVVFQLERELGAGKHVDAESGRLLDIPRGELPDGTLYRVEFLGGGAQDGGLVVARLAVGSGPGALARAPTLEVVLSPASSMRADPELGRSDP